MTEVKFTYDLYHLVTKRIQELTALEELSVCFEDQPSSTGHILSQSATIEKYFSRAFGVEAKRMTEGEKTNDTDGIKTMLVWKAPGGKTLM